MKKKIVIALLALGLITPAVYATYSLNNACYEIYVDFGSLNNNKTVSYCVNGEDNANALQLAQKVVKLEGTQKYGLQVVCRVDSLPGPKEESCSDMPPEDAYWAVLVKRRSVIPDPFSTTSEWNWAETGISDVYLNTGDSLGLVFVKDGKIKWPS